MTQNKESAYKTLRKEIKNANSIGETRLSRLFHKVRMNPRADSYCALCNVKDGEVSVYNVVRMQSGEHFPGDHPADIRFRVSGSAFMSGDEFADEIVSQINRSLDALSWTPR